MLLSFSSKIDAYGAEIKPSCTQQRSTFSLRRVMVSNKEVQPEGFGQFVKKGCENQVCNDKQKKGRIERKTENQKEEKKDKKRNENRKSVGNVQGAPIKARFDAVILPAGRTGIMVFPHFFNIEICGLLENGSFMASRTSLMNDPVQFLPFLKHGDKGRKELTRNFAEDDT